MTTAGPPVQRHVRARPASVHPERRPHWTHALAKLVLRLGFCAAATSLLHGAALAQSPPAQDSLRIRPTLLDFEGGPKDALRRIGLDFTVSVTQFHQGLLRGDGRQGGQFGGKTDLFVSFDSSKAGLWTGFSINFHQEWAYGRDANTLGDGTLIPVNTAMGFPVLGGRDYNTSINISQSFGDLFAVSLGKFNLLDLAEKTPIAGGGGYSTFMNTALAAPISGVTPPYIIGGIASLNTKPVSFTLMVYDPRNAQVPEVIERPFREGVTTSLSATLPLQVAGLPGWYSLRGVYSTKEGFNLNDIPALLLPKEARGTLTREGYRYVQFNAQQYLWQDKDNPGVGWGMFLDSALSDGNPNPFRWRVTTGVGGTGPIAGRPLDRWGIGVFNYALSSKLIDGLAAIGLRRQPERGIEAFYNLAVTPWLRVTADLQWIRPFDSDKRDVVLGALRTQLKF